MTSRETKSNRTRMLVLLALAEGAKHGYEISKFIEQRTEGFFALPFGSLYPVLHRLEKEKLVRSTWIDKKSAKPKKSYELSAAGKEALRDDVAIFRTSTRMISELIPDGI